MKIVVTGSLAYDHIMVFKDEFRNHILPQKVHMLNVSFNVDDLSLEFGGSAGNIAYNLSLMKGEPIIVATGGKDFQGYMDRLKQLGISTEYIKIFKDEYTAQAFVTTDLQDNQITAFHGGATYRAHEQPLSSLKNENYLVIIAPNSPQAMLDHANYCREKKWAFWFDPGQAMNALTGEQLTMCLEGSQGLFVNDYEWEMFQKKTGYNLGSILEEVPYVVVTLGEKGVELLTREGMGLVPAVPDITVVDPTGAGDAFRAGFLYGLQQKNRVVNACQYGCAAASFAIECQGTQNHQYTLMELEERKALIV